MKKLISITGAIILALGLVTSCTNREMGTAGGAVVGGAWRPIQRAALVGFGRNAGTDVSRAADVAVDDAP